MAETDGDLVAQALQGDREAFAELYRRRGLLVRALCFDRTRDHEDAADLTQEVFMRAHARLRSLRDPQRFGPWVAGIARQVCREWQRSRRRDHGLKPRLKHMAGSAASQDVEAQTLREAIATLPEKERLALHAFYLMDQDADQACLMLGISRSGLYGTLSRARARLRRILDEER